MQNERPIDWMKGTSRPVSGRGKHLISRRIPGATSSLALLLVLACVLSLAPIPGARERSSAAESAVNPLPLASSAGASSSPSPFSCPAQTKHRVAEACSGELETERGHPLVPCSLADLSSAESGTQVSPTLSRHQFSVTGLSFDSPPPSPLIRSAFVQGTPTSLFPHSALKTKLPYEGITCSMCCAT